VSHSHRAAAVFALAFLAAGFAAAGNWPAWRGPDRDGIGHEKNLATHWGAGKNVAWTLPMPGPGGSTPVVWGDRIFLTSAEGPNLVLLCVGTDGKPRWNRPLGKALRTNIRAGEGNDASASPSTDGKHVFAFAGSGDFACFDFDGNEVWHFNTQKRYGRFHTQHGLHVTPLLYRDRLYLSLLHADGHWVIALDKATGNDVWKVHRPTDARGESKEAYASPCLWTNGKDAYLVVLGADYATAHRLDNGQEIWRLADLNPTKRYSTAFRIITSPVASPDLIVVPTCRGGIVVGVKPDARGVIHAGDPGELWRKSTGAPDVPSPLIHDGVVYLCRENGVLIALDAKTGKELYNTSLHRSLYRASPVLSDGKLYVTARDGTFTVVRPGPKFEKIAENELPDTFTASPALADGTIYLRGFKTLYAVRPAAK
jgi:outer membrane protein assembly factor BamB